MQVEISNSILPGLVPVFFIVAGLGWYLIATSPWAMKRRHAMLAWSQRQTAASIMRMRKSSFYPLQFWATRVARSLMNDVSRESFWQVLVAEWSKNPEREGRIRRATSEAEGDFVIEGPRPIGLYLGSETGWDEESDDLVLSVQVLRCEHDGELAELLHCLRGMVQFKFLRPEWVRFSVPVWDLPKVLGVLMGFVWKKALSISLQGHGDGEDHLLPPETLRQLAAGAQWLKDDKSTGSDLDYRNAFYGEDQVHLSDVSTGLDLDRLNALYGEDWNDHLVDALQEGAAGKFKVFLHPQSLGMKITEEIPVAGGSYAYSRPLSRVYGESLALALLGTLAEPLLERRARQALRTVSVSAE